MFYAWFKNCFNVILLNRAGYCAQPGAIDEINDPHEEQNRKMHELNKAVGQTVLEPVAQAYSDVVLILLKTRFRILQTIWACLRML